MSDNVNGATEAASPEPTGKPRFLDIPHFNVSSFTSLGQPTQLSLLCGSPSLALDENGTVALAYRPCAVLHIPAVEAKELIAILQDYVDQVEADGAVLTSEFLQGREAK